MATGQHGNNLDFLRLVGAVMVVLGHSFDLSGLKSPPFLWGISIHSGGLVLFFSISGYLVTSSVLRSASVSDYFAKRSLRIFPALIVCVLLSTLVVGPIFTTFPLSTYFTHTFFWHHFLNAALWMQYPLPGVFSENALRAVNGSLWSLPVEFMCYILAVFILMPFRRMPRTLLSVSVGMTAILMALGVYFGKYYSGPPILIYNSSIGEALGVMPYFFVGSVLRLARGWVAFRLDVAALFLAVLFVATASSPQLLVVGRWILLPYVILSVGLDSWPTISDWRDRFGDASYGTYLYAFPVQQIVAQLYSGKPPIIAMLIISAVTSIACGWLSWHLLEKRTLKWRQPTGTM